MLQVLHYWLQDYENKTSLYSVSCLRRPSDPREHAYCITVRNALADVNQRLFIFFTHFLLKVLVVALSLA